jgi:hypothetical protein
LFKSSQALEQYQGVRVKNGELVSRLHADGVSWARIGELVGHGDLVTTARTYTHVIADEAALDYAALCGPHGRPPQRRMR